MTNLNSIQNISPVEIDALIRHAGKTVFLLAVTVILLLVLKKGIDFLFRGEGDTLSGRRASLAGLISDSRRARLKTLADGLYHFLSLIIWFISGLTILSGWDINVTPLLTGAGLLGLAVGLGSQTLIKDVVAGLFIILENQYNQGDTIGVAGVKGRVERISLRTTTLRDENNNVIIVPNSAIQTVIRYQKE